MSRKLLAIFLTVKSLQAIRHKIYITLCRYSIREKRIFILDGGKVLSYYKTQFKKPLSKAANKLKDAKLIVDCHTHINCAVDGDTGTSEHLEAMQTVDACIVLATPQGPSSQVNKRVSEYVSKHKEKMVGFALVEPIKNNISIKSLTVIKEKLGLEGMVLYCSRSGFHPAHSRAMHFYELAQQLGLPVFFHNSGTLQPDAILDYAQPYLLDEVARAFPELKIVIGTMGVPFVEQTLSMVAKHKNVYADLTIKPGNVWQTYNIVVAAHERSVMNKLLFGSGFPSARAGECIETLLGLNMLLADTNLPTVPRGNIRNIIERDTLELLGIKRHLPQYSLKEDK